MHKFILFFALALLFLIDAIYSKKDLSAVIETDITPEMAEIGCALRLSGLIEVGDADRLESYLADHPSIENDVNCHIPRGSIAVS